MQMKIFALFGITIRLSCILVHFSFDQIVRGISPVIGRL